jgi:anaerobic magnesium-protoporphyrin IX monomethyl ester cyclase
VNTLAKDYTQGFNSKSGGSDRLHIKKRKKNPRIALISPSVISSEAQVRKVTPPIGMACLAAVLLENGIEDIFLLDAALEGYSNIRAMEDDPTLIKFGLSDEDIVKRIEKFNPDIVGISSLFSSLTECAIDIANAIRSKFSQLPIIMGGNHASFQAKVILMNENSIDWILSGEADYTFVDFVQKYFGGGNFYETPGLYWRSKNSILQNPNAPFIIDMEKLPSPAFHLYDMEKYFDVDMPHNPFTVSNRVGTIMTGRGCPQDCYYCSSPDYAGRVYRSISSKRTVEIVHELVEKYDIKELQILDDTFTTKWKRAIEIMEGIAHLNLRICFPNSIRADLPKNRNDRLEMFKAMKKAGVVQFGIGIEHGDQEFLNHTIKKRLDLEEVVATVKIAREVGILVHAVFMMGFPFETDENRQKTIQFAKSLNADSYSISLVAPLPGTRLWDIVKDNNLFIPGFNVNRMTFTRMSIQPHDITPDELYNLVDLVCRELNETAQIKHPEQSREKARLFKNKKTGGDRKFHFAKHLIDD